ncbi:MAG: methyltransferase domain-containing protein [Dolichospermum sp.]
MIQNDLLFIEKLLQNRMITSPVLELGAGYGGETCRDLIIENKVQYFGTDMQPGVGVDFVANFEDSPEQIKSVFSSIDEFSTILVLNVLEHTFDPIRVLDNVIELLKPGGICVIITPTLWPLHNYPYDCYRINRNFYEEYCRRRNFKLLTDYFEYIGFGKIKDLTDSQNNYQYPLPYGLRSKNSILISKFVHKLFNTYGRSMFFPSHVAVGCVIQK